MELPAKYDPSQIEDKWYAYWLKNKFFHSEPDERKPFTIVIPPPNVTGVLHMGHMLNNTLQDVLVRRARMTGKNACWVPGTDHASIATEAKVVAKLKDMGIEKSSLTRANFMKYAWDWRNEHGGIILEQLKKLGASCDWDRTRFTMDPDMSEAVINTFVYFYKKGMIYRGVRMVNWDPEGHTAVSDEEVIHKDVASHLYYLKYPIADASHQSSGEYVTIATTRPETIMADAAVCINPADERYHGLRGKKILIPLINKEIPIIEDSYVEIGFGTGCLKVTPAHDANDYAIGIRHNLPVVSIIDDHGKLNENAQILVGEDRFTARKKIVRMLDEAGLLLKTEDYTSPVGFSERTNAVIEPMLSRQWFLKTDELSKRALSYVESGEIKMIPDKFKNVYRHWMETAHDWCISRQLWWGHRIPVWYCKKCGETIVSREDPCKCPKCGADASQLEQDPDVLDTWFSSWLWPFSTLGWPQNTDDMKTFYPTTALVTAYDIIFFWVSRMIMAGLEFTGKAPFHDIYIHGLVRDKQGRKMSKSLGNGIDPLEIIDMYGADALKFTLSYMCAQGQDILIDKESFKMGSRFCNKVWNASRYILGNLEGRTLVPVKDSDLTELDKWIYACLDHAVREEKSALESYRYNDGASTLYEYFWNDFCDWYVEATKLSFRSGDDKEKDRAVSVLLNVLEESLRLLHPYLPFVTEEIYGKLPLDEILANRAKAGAQKILTNAAYKGLLVDAPYPTEVESRTNETVTKRFEVLQELIRNIRGLRVECGLDPAAKLHLAVMITKGSSAEVIKEKTEMIELLAGVEKIDFVSAKPAKAIGSVGSGFEAFLLVDESINKEQLIARFNKELEAEKALAQKTEAKLGGKFAQNAPAEVVQAEKEKLEESKRRIEKLSGYVQNL